MGKKYLAYLQLMIIIDVIDFKEKYQLFNSYLSEQCTLLKIISTLANTRSKHTNNILDTIIFSKEDIYKIIKNLDPNKTHGHDMIKLCSISICKPLEIIFQNCLRSDKFPSEWKKTNVVPTYYFIITCFNFFFFRK